MQAQIGSFVNNLRICYLHLTKEHIFYTINRRLKAEPPRFIIRIKPWRFSESLQPSDLLKLPVLSRLKLSNLETWKISSPMEAKLLAHLSPLTNSLDVKTPWLVLESKVHSVSSKFLREPTEKSGLSALMSGSNARKLWSQLVTAPTVALSHSAHGWKASSGN